jgi:hypothetical protein
VLSSMLAAVSARSLLVPPCPIALAGLICRPLYSRSHNSRRRSGSVGDEAVRFGGHRDVVVWLWWAWVGEMSDCRGKGQWGARGLRASTGGCGWTTHIMLCHHMLVLGQ